MEKDPRVIKTKKAIEDAFISLVELKGYSSVKMVDIAKKARVNRNTIYLHYNSKEEIISSIISNSFVKELTDFELEQYVKSRFNRFKLEKLFTAFFTLIDKNADLYRILLLEDSLIGFFNSSIKRIKKALMKYFKNTPRNGMVIEYILFGIFGIINSYTVYASGTIQENAKLVTDLTMSCLRRIQL
mgnify:CR=1 FL=1